MRIKLFHKLFLVLIGTSLCSVLLFAGFAHWYSSRNFLRYLNDDRDARLMALCEQLLTVYARDGDWHTLQGDERAWHRLLREVMRSSIDKEEGAPPPTLSGTAELAAPPHDPRQPHHDLSPPLSMFKRMRLVEPTLYDTAHRIVVGSLPYRPDLTLREVSVEGRAVGYVGVAPLRHPANARDVRFARRQAHILFGGAAFALILSLLAAALVARRLSRPIMQIGEGARALASGHFETRLPTLGGDEIGVLAGDFNVLARTLEENESSRRRWFADVSHELRTPLAIMRGELEAVRDGIRVSNAELIESLSQETARLTHLVDDLYQLARADIGALDYEFTHASLGALVTESLSHFAHRWQQAGLEYHYDIDAELCAALDARRVLQMLENVFENCCRYTDAPGHIAVTVRREGKQGSILIEDSAPGVAACDLPLLFEPLHRVEPSRSRAFGGSGLGLAICSRIVTAHGGSITASPSTLGGLAVHIHLPLVN